MTAIHVSVTAEHIAAGRNSDPALAHNRLWGVPVEEALSELTGEQVSIDGGDGTGNIATIGQGTWTLVVDLPEPANEFLDARWNDDVDGEPFEFDIAIDDWLVALLAKAATTEEQGQAVLRVDGPA